jgi:hypothetical protein
LRHIPAFVLHQVTCQFATGQTLFGPLNLSLEPSLCGLVGRNGVGKTRLLRLLAGLILLPAAILSAPPLPGGAAADAHAGDHPRALLGYAPVFDALSRLEQGNGWPTISIYWMATGISPIA